MTITSPYGLGRFSQCTSCQAQLRWVVTEQGKRMPLDAQPNPEGNMVCIEGVARMRKPEDTGPFWLSHFATCPNADQHRKPRQRRLF